MERVYECSCSLLPLPSWYKTGRTLNSEAIDKQMLKRNCFLDKLSTPRAQAIHNSFFIYKNPAQICFCLFSLTSLQLHIMLFHSHLQVFVPFGLTLMLLRRASNSTSSVRRVNQSTPWIQAVKLLDLYYAQSILKYTTNHFTELEIYFERTRYAVSPEGNILSPIRVHYKGAPGTFTVILRATSIREAESNSDLHNFINFDEIGVKANPGQNCSSVLYVLLYASFEAGILILERDFKGMVAENAP